MGQYFNPGNISFQSALNSQIYVDKSGIIGFTNSVLNTEQRFVAVSRARRFGKSMAVELLSAYYSRGCDSRKLFNGLKAATLDSFATELNNNDVIIFDVQAMYIEAKGNKQEPLAYLQSEIIGELRKEFSDILTDTDIFLPSVLAKINDITSRQFIILIDEWDCFFREEKGNKQIIEEYIAFLRALFKNSKSKRFIKLAYITGILPIKKYGTQSALNNFKEYTMVSPDQLAEYVGFTEAEVKSLCERFDMDFEECRRWYDGYSFTDIKSVYNPNSVVEAMLRHKFNNYWTKTDTYEVLADYIGMNIDGLKDDIISMLAGKKCRINPIKFQNDMVTINSKDDVMTSKVYIPNREIAAEFANAVEDQKQWGDIARAIRNSEDLIDAILENNPDFIAKQLDIVHEDESSVLTYNNENSLACAINIAFYTAFKYYSQFRVLDTGKGFADMVYIPRPGCEYPALLIELKYNDTVDSAIKQIKEKRYNGRLTHYLDNLVLIGINYDKQTKKHTISQNAKFLKIKSFAF